MGDQDESVLDDDELISERQKILKKWLLEFYLSHKSSKYYYERVVVTNLSLSDVLDTCV